MSGARDRPTLGVVAISRDEEADMPQFLQHLLPWVDEIVIVDDASTDRTVEIIRAAGPKVKLVEHPKDPETELAGQRNLGIDNASADWLLHMDIDERVPVDLAREILQAITDPSKDAYRYRRLNFFLHRPYRAGGFQFWNSIHLARRHVLRFKGLWHEEVRVDCGPDRVGQLRTHMWHLNDDSFVERLQKNINMARVEAKLILESNRRVRWYHFLLQPARAAFMAYVVQRGFTAGTLGLLQAVYTFSGTFNRYAWAWDVQNRISRQVLEDEFSQQWESASSESLLKWQR